MMTTSQTITAIQCNGTARKNQWNRTFVRPTVVRPSFRMSVNKCCKCFECNVRMNEFGQITLITQFCVFLALYTLDCSSSHQKQQQQHQQQLKRSFFWFVTLSNVVMVVGYFLVWGFFIIIFVFNFFLRVCFSFSYTFLVNRTQT